MLAIGQFWQRWRSLSIQEQIAWTRRLLPLAIFLIVASVQIWLNLAHPSHGESVRLHLGIELFVYALLGPLVTWFVLLWIERQLAEKEQVEQRLRQQEQRMLQIADDVRAQIASDLHDSLGPNLFATALKAEVCQKLLRTDPCQVEQELGVIHRALQQSIREVRRAVYALRPLELERLGLFQTLRKLEADLGEINETRMQLTITGDERPLPSEVEVGLFHIVQEALHNVRRHAEAQNVWIQLDVGPQLLCLQIRDDGRGFDPLQTPEGVGLRHMRERAKALSGNVSVQSASDRGTEILICLPLPQEDRR
jgi:two-component system sensor histidine kinase DegS